VIHVVCVQTERDQEQQTCGERNHQAEGQNVHAIPPFVTRVERVRPPG
jgi:hypothetical protein